MAAAASGSDAQRPPPEDDVCPVTARGAAVGGQAAPRAARAMEAECPTPGRRPPRVKSMARRPADWSVPTDWTSPEMERSQLKQQSVSLQRD